MIGRTVALVMVTTLAACGGGGGGDAVSASNVAPTTSASGPGDSEKYAPAGLGDRWTYDVLDNAAASQIENLVVSNQAVGSVTTFALRESSTDPNQPTQDATFFSDPGGLTQVSFSPPDPLQQQVGAYRSLLFPVQPGSFTAFDKPALDFGQDVDGDGKNERRSLKLSVEMAGFEPVDVAAGHFARAAKYIYTATDRVTTTATNRSFTATVASTEWRVPGVGLVKTSSVSSGDGIATTSASQQLRGYRVAGVQRGIGTPLDTLAQGSITSVNSSLFRAPSVAASASGFLVVAFRQASNTTGNWVGRFLDKAGVLQSTVDLSSVMDDGVENPAIASDGSNYLVLAQRSRIGQSPELVAWRVSPQGTLLDGPAGLAIGSGVPSQASVLFDGNRYLVVASMGGAPKNPQWYLNILGDPDVTIHDRDQVHELRARVATPEERTALWPVATAQWPAYDDYQTKTDREIPLVICEPR